MHPHLEEITGYLASVRAELAALVERTPPAAFDRVPADGGWTGTGIIQHLGRAEGSSAKLLERLFAAALTGGLGEDQGTTSWLHSLDHLRVTERNPPFEAPERVRPGPADEFLPSWTSLQAARVRLLRAVATVDGRDLGRIVAPHPFAGELNGYQWVLFIGQHEARHLSQLRETLSEA